MIIVFLIVVLGLVHKEGLFLNSSSYEDSKEEPLF